nr:RecName: Full=30 kDa non-secretory protein 3 [Mycobacterium tuberculosis H37Rv]
VVAFERAK